MIDFKGPSASHVDRCWYHRAHLHCFLSEMRWPWSPDAAKSTVLPTSCGDNIWLASGCESTDSAVGVALKLLDCWSRTFSVRCALYPPDISLGYLFSRLQHRWTVLT